MRTITYRFTVLCLLTLLSPLKQFGQESEIGIWGGLTNSFGDINNTISNMQYYKPAAGVFYRHNYNNRIAGYIGVCGGQTFGYDSLSDNPYQHLRNLSFRTNIYELSSRIDFNFLPLEREKPEQWFSPFVFIGVSLYYFNPQAYFDGSWVDLQPLGTEGQQFPELTGNEKYKRVQLAVPMGGGFKFALNKNITVGIESNWHWLFTDYLDDVSTTYVDPAILAAGSDGALAVALADRSTEIDVLPLGDNFKQRGDSEHDDNFMYTGVFFSYTFVDLKCPSPGKWGHR